MNKRVIKTIIAAVMALTMVAAAVAFPLNSGAKVYAATVDATIVMTNDGIFSDIEKTYKINDGDSIKFEIKNNYRDGIVVNGVAIASGATGYVTVGPFKKSDEGIQHLNCAGALSDVYPYILEITAGSGGDGDSSWTPHEHVYEWVETTAPTAEHDGEEVLRCTICGKVIQVNYISAAGILVNQVVDAIKNAAPGATVTIETTYFSSYPKAVIDALKERSDVTLVTKYLYKGTKYSMTIPAGTATKGELLDDKGYAGFRRLAEAPYSLPTTVIPW